MIFKDYGQKWFVKNSERRGQNGIRRTGGRGRKTGFPYPRPCFSHGHKFLPLAGRSGISDRVPNAHGSFPPMAGRIMEKKRRNITNAKKIMSRTTYSPYNTEI
ncbi:MAG: hypothetical protein ABIJ21_05175 [Nanoarchaeota archaeon]